MVTTSLIKISREYEDHVLRYHNCRNPICDSDRLLLLSQLRGAFRDAAGVPPRYAKAELTLHPAASSTAETKTLSLCNSFVIHLVRYYGKTSTAGILFCGNFGTGKTHLSCAILNTLNYYYLACRYESLAAIPHLLKRQFGHPLNEFVEEIEKRLIKPYLLVLDDEGFRVPGTDEGFFNILNQRYGDSKPTIICSNFSPRELSKTKSWKAIMDRMRDNKGHVLRFTWSSYRPKNKLLVKEGG